MNIFYARNSVLFQDNLHRVCFLKDHVCKNIYRNIHHTNTHYATSHRTTKNKKKINKIKQYRYHNRFYTVIKQI